MTRVVGRGPLFSRRARGAAEPARDEPAAAVPEGGGAAPAARLRIVGAADTYPSWAELPPRYQQVLRLRFLESCTIKEAAAELGVSVANAKVLQHRALRQAARLTQQGGT